jgi:hypothetical protein
MKWWCSVKIGDLVKHKINGIGVIVGLGRLNRYVVYYFDFKKIYNSSSQWMEVVG